VVIDERHMSLTSYTQTADRQLDLHSQCTALVLTARRQYKY